MEKPSKNPLPMPPLSLRLDDLKGYVPPKLSDDEMAEYLRWGRELRKQEREQQEEYEQTMQRDHR